MYIYICVYLALPDPKVATKWTFCDYVYTHILYNVPHIRAGRDRVVSTYQCHV